MKILNSKLLIFTAVLFCGVFGLAKSSLAATYWVSPTGTVAWTDCKGDTPLDGTAACSLATANSNLAAGDTVYLRSGTYIVTGNNSIGVYAISPKNSGTSGSMITYSAYTPDGTNYETVTIKGNDAAGMPPSGGMTGGIQLKTKSYIKVAHLIFTNLWMNLNISVSGHHNDISYCTFQKARDPWADIIESGTVTNTNNSTTVLEDNTKNWTANQYRYKRIYNATDKSTCGARSNDATTITGVGCTGGTDNHWDTGDRYQITYDYTDMGVGITENSTHNWVHHNVFADYGGYLGPSTTSGADIGGVIRIGALSTTSSDLSANNTIEYNHMYHGGHQVFAMGSGKYQVVRNNYLHNESWFNDSAYSGTCAAKENGVCGYRVFYSITGDTNGGHSLVEGNTIGYGAQYGGGHAMTSGSGQAVGLGSQYNIFRQNNLIGNGEGMFLEVTGAAAKYNRIYNNTFFHNGHNESSYGVPSSESDPYTYDQYRVALTSYSTDCAVMGNEIVNNIFYDNWAERNIATGNKYYPAIFLYNSTVGACNNTAHAITNNYMAYDANHQYENTSPYAAETNPKFTNATLPSDSASIIAAWSNYAVTSPDLSLRPDSTAINSGTYLTAASGSGSNSTALIVEDASYFQDGTWGSDLARGVTLFPDWIAIGTVSNIVQISSINYDTNAITLASPTTWNDNDPIWLYRKSDGTQVLNGSAPDMGAYEYSESGDTTAPSAPSGLSVR